MSLTSKLFSGKLPEIMIVLFVTGLKQPKEITMKKFSKIIVGVFCALLLATSAFAADTAVKASTNAPVAVTTTPATGFSYLWEQPKVETPEWVFAIGGSGATGLNADSETAFGLTLQLGRTAQLVLPFEYGVRQSFSYASSTPASACISGNDESTTLFTTKLYADWTLLTYKKLDVFAGGNVGLTYGNTSPLWTAAPEAGARYWLAKNVAVEGRLEFPFDLNDGAKFNEAMTYTIGLKLKF